MVLSICLVPLEIHDHTDFEFLFSHAPWRRGTWNRIIFSIYRLKYYRVLYFRNLSYLYLFPLKSPSKSLLQSIKYLCSAVFFAILLGVLCRIRSIETKNGSKNCCILPHPLNLLNCLHLPNPRFRVAVAFYKVQLWLMTYVCAFCSLMHWISLETVNKRRLSTDSHRSSCNTCVFVSSNQKASPRVGRPIQFCIVLYWEFLYILLSHHIALCSRLIINNIIVAYSCFYI